ncbi:hypothetical protein BXZ70DRAFT_1013080 [Cristinia sonorae]|uniref:Uncharacterized protein n=1 Tax=Cristinia sonorae TaxID=1940300 RepID=A0A8K0UE60_9AGAR|nr:hypothetical protein BXZ70DRAFT_1013080 [Cristinia sonorae]
MDCRRPTPEPVYLNALCKDNPTRKLRARAKVDASEGRDGERARPDEVMQNLSLKEREAGSSRSTSAMSIPRRAPTQDRADAESQGQICSPVAAVEASSSTLALPFAVGPPPWLEPQRSVAVTSGRAVVETPSTVRTNGEDEERNSDKDNSCWTLTKGVRESAIRPRRLSVQPQDIPAKCSNKLKTSPTCSPRPMHCTHTGSFPFVNAVRSETWGVVPAQAGFLYLERVWRGEGEFDAESHGNMLPSIRQVLDVA